jgi:hypothetical protein
MDKVQETTFTDYNAPSSESFRLYLNKDEYSNLQNFYNYFPVLM